LWEVRADLAETLMHWFFFFFCLVKSIHKLVKEFYLCYQFFYFYHVHLIHSFSANIPYLFMHVVFYASGYKHNLFMWWMGYFEPSFF
jgi:hypothetical protein